MCPPDYFGIEYEINPWMSRSRSADPARAVTQWKALHALLLEAGAEISLLEPVRGLPDMVFTANAALIYRETAYVSRFRHEVRRGETPLCERWFREHGFTVVHPPEGSYFEGAGDALFCGETLFSGYRIRSDVKSHQWIAGQIGCHVLPLELVSPHFYHLDTCFCPLAPGEAIYYPPAFDDYGRRVLAEYVPNLIPVAKQEADRFACNAVVVGRTVILNTGCPRLEAVLQERGYTPRATQLDEFLKSGGSAKCLTLRLDGEEAAAWARGAEGVSAAEAGTR
jgi:N-dimethylarginine dimethylaminohydrolase